MITMSKHVLIYNKDKVIALLSLDEKTVVKTTAELFEGTRKDCDDRIKKLKLVYQNSPIAVVS